MELTLGVGRKESEKYIYDCGHNAPAAKGNNNKEVLQKGIAQKDFYYSQRRFKNLVKPLIAACKECRPGTSEEVLSCFYTARTGWSFILSAKRLSST